jgi:hypothetical protein
MVCGAPRAQVVTPLQMIIIDSVWTLQQRNNLVMIANCFLVLAHWHAST